MQSIVENLSGWIWSPALIILCLGAGLYFSIKTRFLQVRHFRHMIALMREGKGSKAGISSFQALAISLSGRVGTGNIAGVATAIAFGGPGALFWMWLVAFLGAATAFIEATLAQLYKEKDENGLYRGGSAYFIEKQMGNRVYATAFAFTTLIAMGFCLPGIQANSVVASVNAAWEIPPIITAVAFAVMVAIVILGGVKRIARVAQFIVPFMAIAYIFLALIVLGANYEKIPAVLSLVFKSAFGLESGYGAIIGLAVQWGVKRGIYSNEAGQGTGPHSAAAAEVSHPVKQGLVQAFSVYVDTLAICTATGLMILVTGAYNVHGVGDTFLYQGLPSVEAGPEYAQSAIDSVIPNWGSSVVAIALFFFCYTTVLAYYYMAETNLSYMNRKWQNPWLRLVPKALVLVSVIYGGLTSMGMAWAIGDIGVGMMAWLNIVAILIIQKPAIQALHAYEYRLKHKHELMFDPKEAGIKGADFWDKTG